MEAYKKNLKISGTTLIFVAVCELIISIVDAINPASASYAALVSSVSGAEDLKNVMIGTAIVISVIAFLLLLFIGLKAIIISKGGRPSNGMTILAWVLFVIYVISALYSVYDIAANGRGILESHIVISICVAMSLFAVIFAQKKYLNSKER